MIGEKCSKCRKLLASSNRCFQCAKCGAWFCPSCMDRHCLFCKGNVAEVPIPS